MKGLNIKRIAAIGLGAALVGSALAPVVTATTTYNNIDTDLKKEHIVNSTGTPVVDIVVGSMGQAPDVVWAGNIAARVAQLAAVPKEDTGTPTEKTVDVTVGGAQVVSGGARELTTANLDSTADASEYVENIGNTYFKNFANTTYNATRDGNTTFSVNVQESIDVNLDARMNITTQAVKDLVAEIGSSKIAYKMSATNLNLGQLPFSDTGSDDYVPVSFMGKQYVIDSMNSTSVVLVSDNAERIYAVDDSITGVKARDSNKVYSLKFVAGLSSGSSYVARIALIDDSGAKVDEQTFSPNSDVVFRDAQGRELLATKVRLKNIYTNGSSTDIIYSFSAMVGSDRIEIRNGREVPYDPNNNTSNKPWVAEVNGTTTSLTIKIKNDTYYANGDTPLYSQEYSFNPTGKKTAFNLFEGTDLAPVGRVVFKGFYDTGVQKSVVSFKKGQGVATETTATSYGAINYVDVSGQSHSIPMAISLNPTTSLESASNFKFDGIDHAYSTDSSTAPTKFYLKSNSTDSNILPLTPQEIGISGVDVNYDTSVLLTGKNNQIYRYLAKRGTDNKVWLALAGRDANNAILDGVIGTTQFDAGKLTFLGTDLNDDNGVSTVFSDYRSISPAGHVPYYYPDMYEFSGVQNGSSNGGTYRTAVFGVTEGTSFTGYGNNLTATVYIDTEGGNSGTVDTANISKLNYSGKTTAVEYKGVNQDLKNFSEYLGNPGESSANYLKAYTDRGTKIVLGGRELTFTLPDKQMPAYFTVESNDVTTQVTGGESFKGVKAGETKTTSSGTKVTVDAISGGAASASGVTLVKVPKNLVKLDTDAAYGKSIIVGGHLVNKMAVNLKVDGSQKIEDMLTSNGDYVAAVLEDGKVVVAGWTAEDTGRAATILINKLEQFM